MHSFDPKPVTHHPKEVIVTDVGGLKRGRERDERDGAASCVEHTPLHHKLALDTRGDRRLYPDEAAPIYQKACISGKRVGQQVRRGKCTAHGRTSLRRDTAKVLRDPLFSHL
ncbi:hypothetical protein WI372_08165 [Gemmatimonadota bacterium DH-20]|uniref:Ribosomal protein S14 n=1 Tax=Gaopeijia maritima TaxID=3119007 RepID=A0ABU9EA49_9BACT